MKRSDGSKIHVLGITGGSGTGKSTVASILAEQGARVIDCDKIGHVLTEEPGVLDKLRKAFGDEIIDEGGKLKRKVLGGIVFSDKDKLVLLNSIMHNLIEEEILNRLKVLNDGEICVIDAAVLFKKGFLEVCDKIWVVTADEDFRIKRIAKRDKLLPADIKKRMDSQVPIEDYLKLADFVIVNDGDFNKLKEVVIEKFKQFKCSRGQKA